MLDIRNKGASWISVCDLVEMKKERLIVIILVLVVITLACMLRSEYVYRTYAVHPINQSISVLGNGAPLVILSEQEGAEKSRSANNQHADESRDNEWTRSGKDEAFLNLDSQLGQHQDKQSASNVTTLPENLKDCHRELISGEQWSSPKVPDALQGVQQENVELSDHICKEWLLPPFTTPRHLQSPQRQHYSQRGQSAFVDNLLNQRRNGFYIESGAADGEGLSNSLFFEKTRNWTGLLVEANPKSFQSILSKSRSAYMVNACLSPTKKPMVIPFRLAGYIGGLTDYMENTHKRRIQHRFKNNETISIQCFPLLSILQAMGISHVDYLSLDIEGAEFEVLKTLPLDQIRVDVFSIEYAVSSNGGATKAKLKEIRDYLVTQHGYKVVRVGVGEDVILQKAN